MHRTFSAQPNHVNVLRTNLETGTSKNEAPTVKVEVGIYADEEPDQNLATYLLQRSAEVRKEVNIHGGPLRVLTFQVTPRAAAILSGVYSYASEGFGL